ncbi:MAG: UbiA family prenyltransferase [Candidatus Omnitrophica bacterium]|nr:UbiA family prenyltransferase [Candidatus Omnitrophota bacterium]
MKREIIKNILAYLSSMRLYAAPISVIVGLIGVVNFWPVNTARTIIILVILFFGWGVNQVVNDCLGQKEDTHNAPRRPLITGMLNLKFAIWLSMWLFIFGLIITFFLNPRACLIYIFIFLLNIAYQQKKHLPLLGNIIFGLLLAPCVYYAGLCANPKNTFAIFLDPRLAAMAILIWQINFLLCFYSDFKDYAGDKLAGIRTFVVALGAKKASVVGLLLLSAPFSSFLYFSQVNAIAKINPPALMLLISSGITLFYQAIIFITSPAQQKSIVNLKWFILGVVFFETAVLLLVLPV